jgi:predicted nucleic acid-binding protein
MYLLDTNICIAILKNNSKVIQQFQIKYRDCYISSLVLAALIKHILLLEKLIHQKEQYFFIYAAILITSTLTFIPALTII